MTCANIITDQQMNSDLILLGLHASRISMSRSVCFRVSLTTPARSCPSILHNWCFSFLLLHYTTRTFSWNRNSIEKKQDYQYTEKDVGQRNFRYDSAAIQWSSINCSHEHTHTPVFCRNRWRPNSRVLWSFFTLKWKGCGSISWPSNSKALQSSHDAFHLLTLLSKFLPDLHRNKVQSGISADLHQFWPIF